MSLGQASTRTNIEGLHLRWFIAGAVALHLKDTRGCTTMLGADFDFLVDDTCNKVHKYLTGTQSTDGSWSDMQCRVALEACIAFDVRLGDIVQICW